MRPTHCYYHPLQDARWQCRGCHKWLCSRCAPLNEQRLGVCPACRAALRFVGNAHTTAPFWSRLDTFFTYPLRREPLLLIVLCTVLPALLGPGGAALFVSVLLMGAQTRYLFTIIEDMAGGRTQPPALAAAFARGGLTLIFQQTFIFVALGLGVYAIANYFGPVPGLLAALLVVLALPAIILLLALEGEVAEAINPWRWLSLIASLGWPYFVLYGYLVLLFIGMGVASDFVWQHFDAGMARAVVGMTASYFSMVAFSLMGYVLYQYQDRLDHVTDKEAVDLPSPAQRSDAETLADVDVRLRDGEFEAAAVALAGFVERHQRDALQLERLSRVIQETGDTQLLERFARRFLTHFLNTGQRECLLDVVRQLHKANPQWQCPDATLCFQLAEEAYQQGDIRSALWLLKDFHKRYMQEPVIVADALILTARILANRLKKPEKAAAFLRMVQVRFPARADKADALLTRLTRHGSITDGR